MKPMKLKRKYQILSIVFLILILLVTTKTYAEEYALKTKEYSQEYLDWLDLTEEEKAKTIQPRPYIITNNQDLYRLENRIQLYTQTLSTITLPSSYNLSDYINIKVENQESTQSCWAFGADSAVETTLAKKYNQNYQFSAAHMEYSTVRIFTDGTNQKGFNRTLNIGGNPSISMPYCMNGTGLVEEKDMPFSNYTSKIASQASINLSEIDKQATVKVTDYVEFPSICKFRTGDTITYKDSIGNDASQYTTTQVTQMRNNIKQHIYQNGGVIASMYFDPDYLRNVGNNLTCNVPNYVGNFYSGNHQIVIVGWDDNYSKTNFKEAPTANRSIYLLEFSWNLFNIQWIYIYII